MARSIKRTALSLPAGLVLVLIAVLVGPQSAQSATGTNAVGAATVKSAQLRSQKSDRPCRAINRKSQLVLRRTGGPPRSTETEVGLDRQ
ncbi:MAG: hypothetical protein WAT42_07430 [Candidatus Nanopelagicales bacterium]